MSRFRHAIAPLLALMLGSTLAGTAGGQEVALAIAPLASVVQKDAPVVILVTNRNLTSRPQNLVLPLGEDQADLAFDVSIGRVDGGAVRPTTAGAALRPGSDAPVLVSRRVVTLSPGEAITTRFDAERLASFDQPGAYVIRMTPRWTSAAPALTTVVTIR